MSEQFLCGNTGCFDLTLGVVLTIVVIFGIWPFTYYMWMRWLRLRAVDSYKKDGGDNEDYVRALMGEFYQEGDEDIE